MSDRPRSVSGVFASHVSTGDWQPDDDPPGEVQVLVDSKELQAGLWRCVPGVTPEPVRWVLPAREVIVVLEGTARIEIDDGQTLELQEGDIASMPAGAVTTWHLSPGFKEFWALGSSDD